MRRTRIITLFAIVVSVITGSIAAVPAGAHARKAPTPPMQVTLLADGLQGSVGATIGPDGALYVPEAAARPDHTHRSHDRQRHDVRKWTPASGDPPRWGDRRRVRRTTMYVLVTVVGPDVGGNSVVGIYRRDGSGGFSVFADLGTWSIDHPPATAFDLPDGVQFALQPVPDGFLVSDGHHNRVLHVSSTGEITQRIQFTNIVPTGLAVTHGTVFLAQAGPIPHVPATGKVVSFPLNAAGPNAHELRPVSACSSTSNPVPTGRSTRSRRVTRRATSPRRVRRRRTAVSCSSSTETVRSPCWSTSWTCQPRSISSGNTAFVTTLNGEVWKITNVSKFDQAVARRAGTKGDAAGSAVLSTLER